MTGFAHVQDSRLLGHLFSTTAMRNVFSDTATLQYWLAVEAALARVKSALHLIPEEAGQAIGEACKADGFKYQDCYI